MSETGQISGKIQAGSRTGDKKEDGYEKESHNLNVCRAGAVSVRNDSAVFIVRAEIPGRDLCHQNRHSQ